MIRSFTRTTGGRVRESRASCPREERASTRPPVSSIPRSLEAAIDAADLALREPIDDYERVAVFCNALGGGFIYSDEEALRRIKLKYPHLAHEDVVTAARFLENRIRMFLKPIRTASRNKTSWVNSWRGDY